MLRIPAIRGGNSALIPWQPEEEEALRLAYGKLPTAELARMIDRSESAVKSKALKLGLAAYSFWSPEEDLVLRDRFAHEPTAVIARDLVRPAESVHKRAYKLGLHKSAEYLQSEAYKAPLRENGRKNLKVRNAGFKKGHVPMNKGQKMPPGWAPGRMAETQFKKGEMSGAAQHNYVPIGTLRINSKDGYLERKTNDDHPVPARRWVGVHRLVWEAAHGAIPAGHRVAFKNGIRAAVLEEITVDKLELVTPAEMMRRNTIHQYPPEVKRAMQARGTLIRSINRSIRGERNV